MRPLNKGLLGLTNLGSLFQELPEFRPERSGLAGTMAQPQTESYSEALNPKPSRLACPSCESVKPKP